MVQFTDYIKFVKISPIIIRDGGPSLPYAKNHPTSHQSEIAEPVIDSGQTLDVSQLTYDQAVEAVENRNHRRETYGQPNALINIIFCDDNFRSNARANRDPAAVIYGDLPNSFWAKLLKFLEASSESAHYITRRDAVMMCEVLRQKLRERGF